MFLSKPRNCLSFSFLFNCPLRISQQASFKTAQLSPSKQRAFPLRLNAFFFPLGQIRFLFIVSVLCLLSSCTKWIDTLIFNLFSFLLFPDHLMIECVPFPQDSSGWNSLTNKNQRQVCKNDWLRVENRLSALYIEGLSSSSWPDHPGPTRVGRVNTKSFVWETDYSQEMGFFLCVWGTYIFRISTL